MDIPLDRHGRPPQHLIEAVSRALCLALDEDPESLRTKAFQKEIDRTGHAVVDHAIPLWRQPDFYQAARLALISLAKGSQEIEQRGSDAP